MPKIVDHEQRRREIIYATWQVIARKGLANTTMKGLAQEIGFSSGVLVHYFADKRDLLVHALHAAHAEVGELYSKSATQHGLTGIAALREYMLLCLPLDEHRRMLAAVELAFWAEAVGDDELLRINGSMIGDFNSRIQKRLEEARSLDEIRADIDIVKVTHEFRALMDGLSMQAVVYSAAPSPEQQIEIIDDLLEGLR
ncbi:MAG: TetR/AcrR family transcriptional regulator [Leucobacter sp.]